MWYFGRKGEVFGGALVLRLGNAMYNRGLRCGLHGGGMLGFASNGNSSFIMNYTMSLKSILEIPGSGYCGSRSD